MLYKNTSNDGFSWGGPYMDEDKFKLLLCHPGDTLDPVPDTGDTSEN